VHALTIVPLPFHKSQGFQWDGLGIFLGLAPGEALSGEQGVGIVVHDLGEILKFFGAAEGVLLAFLHFWIVLIVFFGRLDRVFRGSILCFSSGLAAVWRGFRA
jgi:hypothetical protein